MQTGKQTKVLLKYNEHSDTSENVDDHIFVDLAGTGEYPYRSRLENAFDFETVEAAEKYNERFKGVFIIEEIQV